eukprot:gene12352-biopygen18475
MWRRRRRKGENEKNEGITAPQIEETWPYAGGAVGVTIGWGVLKKPCAGGPACCQGECHSGTPGVTPGLVPPPEGYHPLAGGHGWGNGKIVASQVPP